MSESELQLWPGVCVSIVAWWEIQSVLEREEVSSGTGEDRAVSVCPSVFHLIYLDLPIMQKHKHICSEFYLYTSPCKPSVQILFMAV